MLHKHKSCTPTIAEHSLFPNRAPKWPAGPASYQPRAAPWVLSVRRGRAVSAKDGTASAELNLFELCRVVSDEGEAKSIGNYVETSKHFLSRIRELEIF